MVYIKVISVMTGGDHHHACLNVLKTVEFGNRKNISRPVSNSLGNLYLRLK